MSGSVMASAVFKHDVLAAFSASATVKIRSTDEPENQKPKRNYRYEEPEEERADRRVLDPCVVVGNHLKRPDRFTFRALWEAFPAEPVDETGFFSSHRAPPFLSKTNVTRNIV